MSGSGDCPQFVSMLNSAAQSLLTAKTIINKGLHFRLALSKPCSSQLLFALTCVSSDLTKSLAKLKDAHVLFSASNDRIARFSAREWENWFEVLTKVPAIVCQLCSCSFFFLQILDHANIIQLPDAMKVTDAFIRSAQELLFDASSDVDADKVLQNISKIGKTWFDNFCSV